MSMLAGMGAFLRLAIAAACVVFAAAAAHAQQVSYTITPAIENGALKALNVEIVLPGEADGETELEVPDEWGGKTDLWRGISEFRVTGSGLRAVADASPARKVIRHAPGATLTVRYRLAQMFAGDPADDGSNEYRPLVRPGYFHIIGWTAFVRPAWNLATPATVAFKGLPKGWAFASDLEHGALSLADVVQSVSVAGDFRVLTAGKLRIAIRGSWPFRDRDFIDRFQPIVASHHRFWGDDEDAYLVTVMPLITRPGHMSVGGTNLGDAFAFFATNNASDDQLTRVLAHEHMHNWIPLRVGLMPQENDTTEYWFSEGFTDFYTYRLLARDGLWPVEESVQTLNRIMRAYAFSPVRNITNAKAAAGFWSSQTMNELPYQRGLLIAALADARLREASGGAHDLDDVMLAMKRTVAAVDRTAIPPPVRDLFLRSMKDAGVDFGGDVQRLVEKGETVFLPEDVWSACGKLETSEVAEFDRGFDGGATIRNNNVVTGVDPNGPAYAAGLRDGMRIRRIELSGAEDSRVPLTYEVIVGSETQKITYLPAGKRKVTLQELKLGALDAAARKACAARLGGVS